jgi:hypothetical protein
VNTWTKALFIGDALEEHGQLSALGLIERGTQGLLVVSGDLSEAFQNFTSLTRKVQRVAPAVTWLIASLHQFPLLEFVNQHDQPAGRDTQLRSQRLLADPFTGLDHSENTGVSRSQAKRRDALREFRCRVASNLRQQEGRRVCAADLRSGRRDRCS